jgi:hypothetical protein
MVKLFKSLFKVPEPAGPEVLVRRFTVADPTINRFEVDGDAFVVSASGDMTFRLFEVELPEGTESCQLLFRAKIRTEAETGAAYQEMWVRLPGKGEFFSKGFDKPVAGTTDWVTCEIPFFLKKGQTPDLVKLNVVAHGTVRIWIKEIELVQQPLA